MKTKDDELDWLELFVKFISSPEGIAATERLIRECNVSVETIIQEDFCETKNPASD